MIEAFLARRWLCASRFGVLPVHCEQGRSKLTYVKKEELAVVRQQCAACRAFKQNLRE